VQDATAAQYSTALDAVLAGFLMMSLWTALYAAQYWGWERGLKQDPTAGGRITGVGEQLFLVSPHLLVLARLRLHCMASVSAAYQVSGLVRELGEEEEQLAPANKCVGLATLGQLKRQFIYIAHAVCRLFLHHALPAVPILLLGFIALEGREIVRACDLHGCALRLGSSQVTAWPHAGEP
jgi:hypothetical protein